MPILSRTGANVTAEHLLPQPLLNLFNGVLTMGTVMQKRIFRSDHLPRYESNIVTVGDLDISIRPTWTDYHYQPNTHLIVTGHVIFCHVNREQGWYYQPSMRLFSEDPKTRLTQFKKLISRATNRGSQYALAGKKH